jgi:hypothetical protein
LPIILLFELEELEGTIKRINNANTHSIVPNKKITSGGLVGAGMGMFV